MNRLHLYLEPPSQAYSPREKCLHLAQASERELRRLAAELAKHDAPAAHEIAWAVDEALREVAAVQAALEGLLADEH